MIVTEIAFLRHCRIKPEHRKRNSQPHSENPNPLLPRLLFSKANHAFGLKRSLSGPSTAFDALQSRDACGIFAAAFGVILRLGRSHATARLHHAVRRRCGCLATSPLSAANNPRRPMVTVIRPSRARCVKGTIPRYERAVLTARQQHPHSWHFRAGGGAVHSINSGLMHCNKRSRDCDDLPQQKTAG
jgi:hypothetical protein